MHRPEYPPEPICPTEQVVAQPEIAAGQHHSLNIVKKLGRGLVHFGLAASFGLGLASIAGDSTVDTEMGQAKFETEITDDFSGSSRINTPVVDVGYPTHKGPFGIEVTIEDVKLSKLVDTITDDTAPASEQPDSFSEIFNHSAEQVSEAAKDHALKYLGLLGIGTVVGYLATDRRAQVSMKRKLAGSLIAGGLVVGIPVISGATTWDDNAFNKPEYSADLPPGMDLSNLVKNFDKFDASVADQARYSLRLVNAIEDLNTEPEADIAVRGLAISDIHQRNVYPTIKTLVDYYGIDFVMDNGDIVDWGSRSENGFFLGQRTVLGSTDTVIRENGVSIADLGVPYIFTRGNHDHATRTVGPLSEVPGVVVLELGEYHTQNGLVITGVADPLFTPDLELGDDIDKDREVQAGIKLREQLVKKPADIAITHNPIAGNQVTSGAQLQISGHTHKFKYTPPSEDQPLARLNTATAGGAGARNLSDNGKETPQTFTITNFSKDCRLISLDVITITSLDGEPRFTVRHIPVKNGVDPKNLLESSEERVCD